MTIQVRLFAIVRETAGKPGHTLQLSPGDNVAAAIQKLACDIPAIEPHLRRCAFAVNQVYAPHDTILQDDDELAVIPPVSGG